MESNRRRLLDLRVSASRRSLIGQSRNKSPGVILLLTPGVCRDSSTTFAELFHHRYFGGLCFVFVFFWVSSSSAHSVRHCAFRRSLQAHGLLQDPLLVNVWVVVYLAELLVAAVGRFNHGYWLEIIELFVTF